MTIEAVWIKETVGPCRFYHSFQGKVGKPNSAGWAKAGLCPFHDDSREGNFRVNLDSGGFKCFSCGAKGGDIITYIQLRDSLSFEDALLRIYERFE